MSKFRSAAAKALPIGMSPFPPLRLSPADCDAVRDSARAFLDEELDKYLDFVRQHGDRRLPREDWKLVAEKNDFRVYTPRRLEDGERVGDAADDVMSILVGAGVVDGPVSDCVLAAFTPNLEHELLKAAYSKDAVPNCAVLAVLDEPTPQDPFRSLKIMWYVKAMSWPMKLLVKDHDSVFIDGTGVLTLPNGERVGYDLSHTVDLPQVSELKQYDRINMSIFTLWRHLAHDRAEVYMRTFLDLRGLPPRAVISAINDISKSFALILNNYAHAGKMKKLAWMLRGKMLRGQAVAAPASSTDRQLLASQSKKCVSCGANTTGVLHRHTKLCMLCDSPVCSTCRLKKKIFLVETDNRVKPYKVRLCPPCWLVAANANARKVAIEEVQQRTMSRSDTHFSSSSFEIETQMLDGPPSRGGSTGH